MTTTPFPIEYLTDWDQRTLVSAYRLDQWNPSQLSDQKAWFSDHAVLGANLLTLGESSSECMEFPPALSPTDTPARCSTVNIACNQWPDSFMAFAPRDEFQTLTFASFNNLSRFELLDWSSTEASHDDVNGRWNLNSGVVFTTSAKYRLRADLESCEPLWNLDLGITYGDRTINLHHQVGSVIYEHDCGITAWGHLTACSILKDWERKRRDHSARRSKRKRGPDPTYDVHRDAGIDEVWHACGARSLAEAVPDIQRRFPGVTETEARAALDRHRHRRRR